MGSRLGIHHFFVQICNQNGELERLIGENVAEIVRTVFFVLILQYKNDN